MAVSIFLKIAFLFFIGSVSGWVLEVVFRKYVSKENPDHKWINPGLCTGPYLPLYGCGLCVLYFIASFEKFYIINNPLLNRIFLFILMAFAMTLLEYIAGVISLKVSKVRLWDYTNEWGNIQGIVCPKFSLLWSVLGALYYFLLHSYMVSALKWLSANLTFSFVIGMFFGVFSIDLAHATSIVVKLSNFATEHQIVLRYEYIKFQIRKQYDINKEKYNFFKPFKSKGSLHELLKEIQDSFESRFNK